MRTPLLLLLTLATLLPGSERFGESLLTTTKVEVQPLWLDAGGYTPVQVRVQALVAGEMKVELVGHWAGCSDRWPVPAGSSQHVLLLPPLGESGSVPPLHWQLGEESGRQPPSSPLLHREVEVAYVHAQRQGLDALQTAIDLVGRRGQRHHASVQAAYLPPQMLPDRWQAYPVWLVVYLTAEGLAELEPGQIAALRDWQAVGGHVIAADLATQQALTVAGNQPPLVSSTDGLGAAIQQRSRYRQHDPSQKQVPGTGEVPVAGFIIFALVFALLVGPINFWYSIRSGRRYLLLVATPLLSLGVSLLLLTYNLLAEGLDVQRAASQLVVLDPDRRQAVAFSGLSYFAPFGVSRLELGHSAKLLPMDADDRDSHSTYRHRRHESDARQQPGLFLHAQEAQIASGPWVPARINRRLVAIETRPSRDRLLLQRDAGGGLRLNNGLVERPTAIEAFLYIDADGQRWGLRSLPPGQEAALEPLADEARLNLEKEIGALADDLGAGGKYFWQHSGRAGWFRARLSTPLVPLPGPESTDAEPIAAYLVGPLHASEGQR